MAVVRHHGYTEKIAAKICNLISEGEYFSTIAAMPGMPRRRTMRSWVERHPEFERRYRVAKEARLENMVDQMLAIAAADYTGPDGFVDNAAIQQARLRIDSIKWLAARVLPKTYGDRVEHVGAGGEPLVPVDTSKVALVLLNILSRHRPEAEGEDEPAVVLAPSQAPRHLELPEPKPAEHEVAAQQRVRLGDASPLRPGPGQRWAFDRDGSVKHISELAQIEALPLRVVKS